MNPQLVILAIEEAPNIIQAFKTLFAKQHPTLPAPTSEEVIATFEAVYGSSLLKDQSWLASHPVGT